MTYKMYLLHIGDLEDKELQQTAMTLMDSHRQKLVQKYAKEKDRMRAIAAGLLLQAGFLEWEPPDAICRSIKLPGGVCYKMQTGSLVRWLQKGVQDNTGKATWRIGCDGGGLQRFLPIPLSYEKGRQGKPSWVRQELQPIFPDKKLWHFNLSHSGDYVVLVAADTEVGVDIQEPRETKRFQGGYREFSRMEAFVKCTGEGFSGGYKAYEKYAGKVPGYEFLCFDFVEEYALQLCFAI